MDVKRIMTRAVRQSHPREAPQTPGNRASTYTFKLESDGNASPLWEAVIEELVVEFEPHEFLVMDVTPA